MKEEIAVMDERGRITIPKEIRERIKTRKLRVRLEGNKIILEPVVEDLRKYYGVFRKDLGDADVDELLEESLSELMRDDI
ncbi:MAG: AbrB/MazE/SpoVT family DNA-binding domain-containing protein [Candidatus Aramenus sp.]|jgi:AbrB family looped-hinge helix DNA binding protein|nr:AbrB/MazE/SpoVT family DNA-binding domain-containing protein [Candidatus Aramenus sp.]